MKSQWAMFEVQWELSFLMFEVQWELSFLKRSKMTSQLCTLYVRLCTLYVRVEFPGMHSLGMLLMQGFQFNIIMLLAGLLSFLCDSQTHPLCVGESNGSVVPGQIQHFVLSSWKRWVKIPPPSYATVHCIMENMLQIIGLYDDMLRHKELVT